MHISKKLKVIAQANSDWHATRIFSKFILKLLLGIE